MSDRFAALELSPNAYAVVTTDLDVVWVNSALAAGAGVSPERLVGQKIFDAFPVYWGDRNSEARRIVQRSIAAVVASGRTDCTPVYAFHPTSGDEVFLTVSHTPVREPDGEIRFVLAHVVEATDVVRHSNASGDDGQLKVASCVISSALETEAKNRSLNGERERLEQMFDLAPGFMALLIGPDQRFALANAAYRQLVGTRSLDNLPVREAVPDIYEQGYGDILEEVRRSGAPYVGSEMGLVVHDADGQPHQKYVDFVFQPLKGEAGEALGVFIQGQDVTERVTAARTQDLLVRELRHRVKNSLATVRAIAARTARTAETPEAMIRALETRLIALSTAHELLTQGRWENVQLRELVEGELRPFDLQRISIDGPNVCLPAPAAMPLGLAVHELATNAAKYGALSAGEGCVEISWFVFEAGRNRSLRFTWIERGGPPVSAPERSGFGTELLDGMMRRGSEPVLDFARDGLRCVIRIPLEDIPENNMIASRRDVS